MSRRPRPTSSESNGQSNFYRMRDNRCNRLRASGDQFVNFHENDQDQEPSLFIEETSSICDDAGRPGSTPAYTAQTMGGKINENRNNDLADFERSISIFEGEKRDHSRNNWRTKAEPEVEGNSSTHSSWVSASNGFEQKNEHERTPRSLTSVESPYDWNVNNDSNDFLSDSEKNSPTYHQSVKAEDPESIQSPQSPSKFSENEEMDYSENEMMKPRITVHKGNRRRVVGHGNSRNVTLISSVFVRRRGRLLKRDDICKLLPENLLPTKPLQLRQLQYSVQCAVDGFAHGLVMDICRYKQKHAKDDKHLSVGDQDVRSTINALSHENLFYMSLRKSRDIDITGSHIRRHSESCFI